MQVVRLLPLRQGIQPRSQVLSSPHPKGSEERKTLIQAGHVSPKKCEVTKKTNGERRGQVAILQIFPLLTMEGETNMNNQADYESRHPVGDL